MREYSISVCCLHAGPGDVVVGHDSAGGGGDHQDGSERAEDDRCGELGDGEHIGDDDAESEHAVLDVREKVDWIWISEQISRSSQLFSAERGGLRVGKISGTVKAGL
jgi:hypothetical protein